MPNHENKNENKNGKNLLKTLKTLDYSPISRYIKSDHFACIGKNFTLGASLLLPPYGNNDDNLGDLEGFLAPPNYNDDSTTIPLNATLYSFPISGFSDTGVDVTRVDLSNIISFVFEVDVKSIENFDLVKVGLASVFSGNNNNNNNNAKPYYPIATLAAGPLVLRDAEYIGSNNNVACFTVVNDSEESQAYRVHFICTEDIMYLSENPETLISNYQQSLKNSEKSSSESENNKKNDGKNDKKNDK